MSVTFRLSRRRSYLFADGSMHAMTANRRAFSRRRRHADDAPRPVPERPKVTRED